jgi:hypothetical protein
MDWVARRSWIALVGLLAIAAVFLLHETRGTTLWFDEWTWALARRGGDLDTYLKPHGEHLSLVGLVVYKLLFATAGIDDYTPYRVVVTAAHLVLVALVFVYASRRVGGFLALLAAALMLFFGPGWPDVLWPFQVSWLISLGAGLGALLMLDRADRAGDIGACALLALSLASSSLGVAIALGVAVELAWARRSWRPLWIVAVPGALYGLWWLVYHEASAIVRHNIVVTPRFVADGVAASIAALAGLGGQTKPDAAGTLLDWGRPLAVVAVAILAWRLARTRPIAPRLLGLLTIALSFWALTGLNRAEISPPYANRYLYVGALVVVLVAIELARNVRVQPAAAAVLAVAAIAAAVSNIGVLRAGARYLRADAQMTKADLGALEIGRQVAKPDFPARGLPGFPLLVLTAGPYFATERAVGSPAASPAEIGASSERARRAADTDLIALHGVALRPGAGGASRGAPPRVDSAAGGTAAADGACVRFVPASVAAPGAGSEIQVALPAAGVVLRGEGGPVTVGVRRFADEYQPVGTLAASSSATLRIGPDRATQPWHLRIASARPATVCALN